MVFIYNDSPGKIKESRTLATIQKDQNIKKNPNPKHLADNSK